MTPTTAPSTETNTGVRPGDTASIARWTSAGSGAEDVAANARVPTATVFPSTTAVAPEPGVCSNEPSSGSRRRLRLFAPPSSFAFAAASAATTASASGCRQFFSTAAASARTSSSLRSPPSVVITRFTTGLPNVSVPVLSNTTASTSFARSNTSPPRINNPCRAPSDVPTSTAVGVASPSAQGHATTSTLAASCRPRSSGPFAPATTAEASVAGNSFVPTVDQNANVAALAPMTPYTNFPEISSASLCTGASRCCAASTILTMPAMDVSSPLLITLTTMAPSKFTVPAATSSPARFARGIGSPLIAASST
mmetsp:Transcript_4500/g.15957  ORF Transcript_4500/g.15957 Transcript_4500/m.15957 type:complete len:310 (-) Transcript_4500:1048-1977(-)